jgi:lauroyl/myristoyl acyltransferase
VAPGNEIFWPKLLDFTAVMGEMMGRIKGRDRTDTRLSLKQAFPERILPDPDGGYHA